VARKDYKSNTLVVAPVSDMSALESKSVFVSDVSFIYDEPQASVKVEVSIRYRNEPSPAVLSKAESGMWLVNFDKPVRAAAPGQSIVFYSGDELLGGGIIE
ncbi:MAG: aminomethyltransferase beta-barrel domain-containing protein, partial [Patescibacteria group bacterium]